MPLQIIVAEPIVADLRARLSDDSALELVVVDRDGQPRGEIRAATAFLRAYVDGAAYERVLAAAPGLQWVHSASAGVDGLITPELRERGIVLTNSAGVYAVPIAEWVLHALLSIVKHGPELWAAQQAKRWHDAPPLGELAGKTITILGAGGIGGEIARRAAAFDMQVWGINRSGRAVAHVARIWSGDTWRDALPYTDFLVIATPLTAATRRMIGGRELALLPPHAWLINVARGGIVDEAALITALHENKLGGAALDTFEQEPLPSDSPLWTLPNVIISPHHSGSSPRSTERAIDLFLDNLHRFVQGAELRKIVDLEAGY